MLDQELTQIEIEKLESDFELTQDRISYVSYKGKRIVDIVLTLVIFILFGFWAMAISFFISWIEKPFTSPLFIQKRVGKNGKIFACLKVRTMRLNAHANLTPVQQDDKRVTPIGKFLRKTNLDELPQLFNVLKGDMSLVGPRPYMVFEDKTLEKMIPEFNQRKAILPGITGLSQILGLHNMVSDHEILKQRLKNDLVYLQKNSFKVDIEIIIETISQFIGIRRRSKNAA